MIVYTLRTCTQFPNLRMWSLWLQKEKKLWATCKQWATFGAVQSLWKQQWPAMVLIMTRWVVLSTARTMWHSTLTQGRYEQNLLYHRMLTTIFRICIRHRWNMDTWWHALLGQRARRILHHTALWTCPLLWQATDKMKGNLHSSLHCAWMWPVLLIPAKAKKLDYEAWAYQTLWIVTCSWLF